MKSKRSPFSIIMAVATIVIVAGCAGTNHRRASSVMQYLYPKESQHTDTPTVPVLS